ncbi:MAG TPA: hypothetical protein VGP63_24750, partial [Planctomycetaceae bacterium]|nr:hypothetical protein [Planctomycetaceae bacterium]
SAGIPHLIQHVGPMISIFLTNGQVDSLNDYREVRQHCDFPKYIRLQHLMQRSGVYFHPNQFEPLFLCVAHSSEDLGIVLERFEQAVAALRA